MGTGHAVSGLAVGVLTAPFVSPEPRDQLAWSLTVAGCALLPDLDAKGTTVSRLWGPITGGFRSRLLGKRRTVVPGLTSIVGTVAGGHRRGSHSIVGLTVVLVGVWAAHLHPWSTAFVLALCIGLGMATIGLVVPGKQPFEYWPLNLVISAAGAWWLVTNGVGLPVWLPFGMAAGAFVHILGDMITKQGCPLSWPMTPHRVSLLPLSAGGPTERFLITPVLAGVTVLALAYQNGYDPVGAVLTAWRAAV